MRSVRKHTVSWNWCNSFNVIHVQKWLSQPQNFWWSCFGMIYEELIREIVSCNLWSILYILWTTNCKDLTSLWYIWGALIRVWKIKKPISLKKSQFQATGTPCPTTANFIIFKQCVLLYKNYFLYKFGLGVSTSLGDMKKSVPPCRCEFDTCFMQIWTSSTCHACLRIS